MLLKLIRFSLGNLIIFLNWIIPPLKQKRTKEDQTINDQKIWVDKIKITTDYQLLYRLDEDDEIKEWKKPVRCER